MSPLKRHWIPVLLMVAVGGLVLTTVTAMTKFSDESKKDRLRAIGTETIATVAKRESGSRNTPSEIWLRYQLDGTSYMKWVKGDMAPGATMRIWVDPAKPREFAAENGSTDDSLGFFNTWAGMPWGLAFFAMGAVPLVQDRRKRR